MNLPEIDFGRIRSTGLGGRREAFEQFVCELAAEDCPALGAKFVRLHGAGGDGGVECFWSLLDGSEHGWQAKFWVDGGDVDKAQLDRSVETALRIHPRLVKYTFAIPVDPTGPTGGRGQSLYEKVYGDEGWLAGWQRMATAKGMAVELVVEWRTDLLTRLQRVDQSGARTRYWFDVDLVRDAWWHDRLDDAVRAARPRYIPELTVDVPAARALAAFCGDPSWLSVIDGKIGGLKERLDDLGRGGLGANDADPLAADVPAVRSVGEELMAALEAWRDSPTDATRRSLGPALEAARLATSDAERVESRAMTEKHGDGWDSPGWRQFQAEYQVSFPAAHVDSLRAFQNCLDDLSLFLGGALEQLPGARCMLLIGPAGAGKTFVACDVVVRRLAEGGPSLVVHGRWFSGGDLLVQLRDRLQLPTDLTGEEALALLNQAGRVSGRPVLLVIDALNETRPRTTWRDELDRVVALIERHDHLRVVFTVRSHYQAQVVPPGMNLPTFIHRGFEGVEFEAIAEYADYYGLEPPTAPPVHGEFDNPLFLRLLCEALKAGGRLSLDQAVMGIDELARLLLDEINTRICDQLDAPRADRIVHVAMTAFADAVAAGPKASLERTTASNLVRAVWPDHTAEGSLLEALISEGLLAEDIDPPGAPDGENVVTIAFERLGHHMIIDSALSGMTTAHEVAQALSTGRLCEVLGLNGEPDRGLLEALSVAVAHRLGVELTAFNNEIADQGATVAAVIAGLPWRSVESITDQTRDVVLEALGTEAAFPEAAEMLFRLAARPDHPLNADFLYDLLSAHSMGERDSYLVPWLHQSQGTGGAVDRLISWGRTKDIAAVGRETSRLWVTALLWCTGCPDRRVRDGATLAAARLLGRHPDHASGVLARFVGSNDDWIVERACYVSYAALLRGGTSSDWRAAADIVWHAVFAGIPPANAAIRDEARAIVEAAAARVAPPPTLDQARTIPPYESPWPINWPSQSDIAKYDRDHYPKLVFSCTSDDFYTYQIDPAFRDMLGVESASAARRIVQDVIDLGYDPQLHAAFDVNVLRTFGGGRGKPAWIERIGKKYQWIALARLIGVVGDHAAREPQRWDPPPPPVPGPQSDRLRQLDPTVCEPTAISDQERPWVPIYDWHTATGLTDEAWVADDVDLPDVGVEYSDQTSTRRVLLNGSYNWDKPEGPDSNRRGIWAVITSLLVRATDLDALVADLEGKDLSGHDLFRGPMFLTGFVGEYPYGHHLAAELQIMNHEASQLFGVSTSPATYDLLGEYEYAPGDLGTVSLDAPAPEMFGPVPGSLKWDGRSAWIAPDGRVIASVLHALGGGGRNELTIDRSWLHEWLDAAGRAIVWFEMVGKDVYTQSGGGSPGRLIRTRVRYRTSRGIEQLEPVCLRSPPRDG